MNEKWLKQYKENYLEKSNEAKEIAGFLKENYKGNSYVPWATMERLTYMQDPNAEFKTLDYNGKLIWTDNFVNENCTENKDGVVNKTTAVVVSHFVKVSCTFLGKTFIEDYPIQDQDYTAAKIYNQNLVNKALKRALAKVASRATGLGLKLYEQKDLQFDEDKEEKKPVVKKTTKKEETKVEEPTTAEPQEVTISTKDMNTTTTSVETPIVEEHFGTNDVYSKEIVDLCALIKSSDKEKMTKILQNLNTPILKQHKFILSQEDSEDVLCEKLSHFNNVEVFTKAIKNMLG